MKWIIKLIITFLLAISLVFLLKYNQTTIVVFTANSRIDVSLNIILIASVITVIGLIYGVNLFHKIKQIYNKRI
jgi:uncharacterized protein HemY